MTTLYQGQLLSWQYHSVVCRYNNKCVYIHNQESSVSLPVGQRTFIQQIHVKTYKHISNRDMSNQSGTDWSLSTQSRSDCYVIAMFYNSAINVAAAHDIHAQLIHFIQYIHTLWPCSCPCPTNKHVPHSQLIDRISHLTWADSQYKSSCYLVWI